MSKRVEMVHDNDRTIRNVFAYFSCEERNVFHIFKLRNCNSDTVYKFQNTVRLVSSSSDISIVGVFYYLRFGRSKEKLQELISHDGLRIFLYFLNQRDYPRR
jgi:hypothetical protein